MNVWPVIHVMPGDLVHSREQARHNADLAALNGCTGVFLISMEGEDDKVPEIAHDIKIQFPELLVGINLLTATAQDTVTLAISHGLNAAWTDSPGITSRYASPIALNIAGLLKQYPDLRFFGSVAFKYQAPEPDPGMAALAAAALGMIPTTSGPATGSPAQVSKLESIRAALGPGKPLALASGLSPANIADFQPLITDALVATGISLDEHRFCPWLLAKFMQTVRNGLLYARASSTH